MGTPRADKDAVTDRYRYSLLSPVRRLPDDPQLSLSSLSRVLVSRRRNRFSVARIQRCGPEPRLSGTCVVQPAGRGAAGARCRSAGTKRRSAVVLADRRGALLGCLRGRRRSTMGERSRRRRHATPSRRAIYRPVDPCHPALLARPLVHAITVTSGKYYRPSVDQV